MDWFVLPKVCLGAVRDHAAGLDITGYIHVRPPAPGVALDVVEEGRLPEGLAVVAAHGQGRGVVELDKTPCVMCVWHWRALMRASHGDKLFYLLKLVMLLTDT